MASLAEEYDIDPACIVVEVTESGLFEDLSTILDVLARLRIKGFDISIDDFGTGYAMMQQLRHIPATQIKIDQSFVGNMQVSNSDRIVVEKTVEIGHELGLKVVAEGVETVEQLDFLRKIGCDIVQGYYFSRPLAPKDLMEWLSNYRNTKEGVLDLVDAMRMPFMTEGAWTMKDRVSALK
jgi:EAL domain-containing protein (putative c-di-GMP-specific phosphodiesterase class I)